MAVKTVKNQERAAKAALTKRSLQKFMKNKMACAGIIVLFTIVVSCICAPLLTDWDPALIDMASASLAPGEEGHLLGTDRMGRDMFARLLYGGRWALFLGVTASVCTHTFAAILGVLAGYFGGIVDRIIVTSAEMVALFPTTLLFILLAAVTGRSITVVLVVWILTGWGGTMRITRSKIMSLRQEPFVESCRANGISNTSIMFHHIIPNTLGPVILNMTSAVGGVILREAGLSYLNIGLPPDIPTWGNIVTDARRVDILLDQMELWVYPGIVMLCVVLSINFIGDGLRDALDATTK